jgi:mannose-6-phosphate isomerase-like protein (cupin superfamily)
MHHIAPPLAGNLLGAADGQFVLAEWQDQGGNPGKKILIAPTHVHHSDDEAWYVLEGRLRFRIGEDEVEAVPGTAVMVPRGTVHTYWNPFGGPARYIIVMTPNIHRLIQAIHAMPVRSRELLEEVFEHHDSSLVPD